MDELRQFVAKRVKSAGNRERYLALQFDQAIDSLTCDKYKTFRKLCTVTEWKCYEAKILATAGERLGHGATSHPHAPQGV